MPTTALALVRPNSTTRLWCTITSGMVLSRWGAYIFLPEESRLFRASSATEFLLVDLVNNLDDLAESKDDVLERVAEKAASCDATRLLRAANDYGKVRTKRFFSKVRKAVACRLTIFTATSQFSGVDPDRGGEKASIRHWSKKTTGSCTVFTVCKRQALTGETQGRHLALKGLPGY